MTLALAALILGTAIVIAAHVLANAIGRVR